MKSLILILLSAGASWHYIDLRAESALQSALLPAVFVLSLIALAIWIVLYAGGDKRIDNPSDRFDL